jgi:tetratricopeptide (TPR) repeat protein
MDEPQMPYVNVQRAVRVFVSSTFRDMHTEREELIKRIFPQLRKLCDQRGVTWGEVDLRWGITDEQTAEGKVLPICLDEIQRCRPYFIGLLGERYGWVSGEISPELIEREPWLAEHLDRSITELEILHGVLNNPEMAENAYFYFRDPKFIDTLSIEQREIFLERPSREEIERFGKDESERRSEERKQKLSRLKERILTSGFPVRLNYLNPKELGEWVLQDLTTVIDQHFPEDSRPDQLGSEASEHEIFAASRSVVYIGRQAYFDQLDSHVQGAGPPVVVLGESGSGKSALLANWAYHYRATHPNDFVLMHFIGATPFSADWAAMLRRIMGELQRRYGIEEEIPGQPEVLRGAFASWLHRAAAKGHIVLILDALNQLEDYEGALDLVWLPAKIPANVRMILSTLPGKPLEELKKRAWPSIHVDKLNPDERKKLVQEYLGKYTKTLSPARLDRIISADQSANPLFLSALLEELRVFGTHEQLDWCISHYLTAKTVGQLFEKILTRYEQDYDRDRPGLVRDAMRLIWAARRGLSEAELLEMLGSKGEPLPGAYWSPFFLAMEASLVNRSGLIGFFHNYLRQAVQSKYIATEAAQQAIHVRLADYFEARDLSERKLDELPWQLLRAKFWQRLYDRLSDLPFFKAAWKRNSSEFKGYWVQIEANSNLKIINAYQPLYDAPTQYLEYASRLIFLFENLGYEEEAMALSTCLIDHCRKIGDSWNLAFFLRFQAWYYYEHLDLDRAMAILEEAESACRKVGDSLLLAGIIRVQGNILERRHDRDAAMMKFQEAVRIHRELGGMLGLAMALNEQAGILVARGKLEGAKLLIDEAERIARGSGDLMVLNEILGVKASFQFHGKDFEGAMKTYQEKEQICREVRITAGLQAAIGGQAYILYTRGDLDGALRLYKEQEYIARQVGIEEGIKLYLWGVQDSLRMQSVILKDRDDLDGAITLSRESERICRETDDLAGLQAALGDQAFILHSRGDLDGALDLYQQHESVCRKTGDQDNLRWSLENQGAILLDRGELDKAMSCFKKQEQICHELDHIAGLQAAMRNQGVILHRQGDLDGALDLYQQHESVCRKRGDQDGLQWSFGNQASILEVRGNLNGALALYQEQEYICHQIGNQQVLRDSMRHQGLILRQLGDLDGAQVRFVEGERLCRDLGDNYGLQAALCNQGVILCDRGDLKGANNLFEEQERICRELGNIPGLIVSLRNRGEVLQNLGDLESALKLYKEQECICREHGDPNGLRWSLSNQANILEISGEYAEAEKLRIEYNKIGGVST